MTSHLYSLDLGKIHSSGQGVVCNPVSNSVSLLTAGAALWGHHSSTATATSGPVQAPQEVSGQGMLWAGLGWRSKLGPQASGNF